MKEAETGKKDSINRRRHVSGNKRLLGFRRRKEAASAGEAQAYSDVGVLVVAGEIQHVVQSQHARRDLGEVHGRVDVVLRKRARRR